MWTFDSDTDPGYWVAVESPTNVTLRDLASTANGPVAVGDKGVAVGRGQDRWGVILENGPGARSQTLHAVDATDDGERIWFAGTGGALGYYDLRTEERRDHSVPRGNANTFHSLVVAGDRGEEKFLVGDGSGGVLPGRVRDGTDVVWDWPTAPNSGNAVEALTHDHEGYGYAVDVSSNVYMTTPDDGWDHLGVDRAQGSFYDCAFGDEMLLVGGGNGRVFEGEEALERDGDPVWTPTDLGEFAIYGLDAAHGAHLACGESGNVHIRTAGGEWEQGKYDATDTFRAGLVAEQMVVVGAGGLIVERRAPDEVPADVKERYDDTDDEGGESDDAGGDADEPPCEDERAEEQVEVVRWEDNDVESDIDWVYPPAAATESADGDPFDGRGENFDGDDTTPEEDPENDRDGGSEGQSTAVADEEQVDSSADTGSTDESTDEQSDDSGNDEADPPDGPDDEDNDAADPPDEPDGGSGNDESDPPDPNTDSDADSPDRSPNDSDADSPDY